MRSEQTVDLEVEVNAVDEFVEGGVAWRDEIDKAWKHTKAAALGFNKEFMTEEVKDAYWEEWRQTQDHWLAMEAAFKKWKEG